MKFGCLINLVVFSALVWGYSSLLSPTVDAPQLWIIGVVAAGLTFVGWSILYNAWLSTHDTRALAEALNGSPLRHGRWSAAAGTLATRGRTLSSPWTGRDCVMLEYEISHDGPTEKLGDGCQRPKIVEFLGLAMSECEIKTENGAVRLSGAPDLDAIPSRSCPDLEHLQRAREFVRTTDWLDCTGSNLIGQTGTDWTSLTDVEDSFRFDWRMVPLESCGWLDDESAEAPRLTEKCLVPGDQVVAIGFYDEGLQALRSPVGQEAFRIRLSLGTLERAQKKSQLATRRRSLGGLALLLLVNGGLALGHWLYTRHETTQKRWAGQLRIAVEQGDIAGVERGLIRLRNANLSDEHGVTLLMNCKDGGIAQRLIDRGASVNARDEHGNTPVMFAAKYDRIDVLQRLIAAKADVNSVNSISRTTALVQAVDAELAAAENILLAAGAADDRITAKNGEALSDEHAAVEACRQYVAAIHVHDAARLKTLSTADRPATFHDVDWDTWHHTRPIEPKLESGYVRGDDATVAITGPTPKNLQVTWIYQLRREGADWKILRERWPTKELISGNAQ